MLGGKLRREYRIVESTRLHRHKKLVQRIFYQTGSQQIGGNKYSSDSSTVSPRVHQKKTPGLLAYLSSPAGPRSSSPWKQSNIPSWIGCPENRPESSGNSVCFFLCSQMCQGRTLLHTFAPRTRQEIRVEAMTLPLLYLTCQSGTLLFRFLISLPVIFSWKKLSHFFIQCYLTI